jgi:DNA-binding SARP family transcriptional activator
MALELHLLGPLVAIRDGRPLDLRGPKQRAVLAALLVARGRAVSVEHLIDGIWGDNAPARVTGTLQAYISNLRRVLEPERSPGEPPAVLVTRPHGYALLVPDDAVDARRFERLVAHGRSLLADDRAADARRAFDEALDLWRGDALADFVDEPFATAEVTRLEELRSLALEGRIEANLALGEHDAVIPEIEALVAAEPLRERGWALLMLALYRAGRQADALHRFRAARDILADELGLDPGPALKRLEADILSQSPTLDWREPTGRVRALHAVPAQRDGGPEGGSAAVVVVSSEDDASSPPFVGREREVAEICGVMDRVVAGRGGVVLIHGEAGIGKTRLAQELDARARAAGMTVAWGRCLEPTSPPFWPWVPILRALDAAAPDTSVPALERLLPSDADTGEATPYRVYEAITGGLVKLSHTAPLVLILDDLQWADVPSLGLLRFVATVSARSPVLVVGTYRDDEVDEEHRLAQLLPVLAHDARVTSLALSGIATEPVRAFVVALGLPAPSEELAIAIRKRTGGNPFFVSEVVRLLESEGGRVGLDAGSVAASQVPPGVRNVIGRRLSKLPRPTLDLLAFAALAGGEFDVRLLEDASALPRDTVLDGLEAAVVARIVRATDAPTGRYAFSHDLFREVLRDRLSVVRASRVHAAVAEALIGRDGDDEAHVSRIAHHAWHGAQVLGADRAFPLLLHASEHAAARFAYRDAETHLTRALELMRVSASDEGGRTELDTAVGLSQLRRMVYGFAAPQTEEALQFARTLAERTGEWRHLLGILWGLAAVHHTRAEHERVLVYGRELTAIGDRHANAAFRAAGDNAAGATAVHRGEFDEARRLLGRAITVFAASKPAGPEEARVWVEIETGAHGFLAAALAYTGEDEVWSVLHEMHRGAERSGEPYAMALVALFEAWVSTVLRLPERVVRATAHARSIGEEHGLQMLVALGAAMHGWALAVNGDPERGEAEVRSALSALDAGRIRMQRAFHLRLLAETQLLADRPKEARTTIRAARAEMDDTGERFDLAQLRALEERLEPAAARRSRHERT